MMDNDFYLHVFMKEILYQIDKGMTVPIKEIDDAFLNSDAITYFSERFGFVNNNSSMEEYKSLIPILKDVYVSEAEASDRGIENNGLVYLAMIVLELINSSLYDYKMNR